MNALQAGILFPLIKAFSKNEIDKEQIYNALIGYSCFRETYHEEDLRSCIKEWVKGAEYRWKIIYERAIGEPVYLKDSQITDDYKITNANAHDYYLKEGTMKRLFPMELEPVIIEKQSFKILYEL